MKGEVMEYKKVSMNLNENTIENITSLSNSMGESNKTRVVSSAIQIAKQIIAYSKSGSKVVIKNEDGTEQELKFIF